MTDETLANDPRLTWQKQRREHPVMPVEEVRIKAQAVQAKVRRNLVVAAVVGVLLLAVCTIALVESYYTPVKAIAAAMMVVTVAIAYQAYHRVWRLHTLPPDAALKGCLDFYRKELKAQYRSAALTWRLLAPVVAFTFLMWGAFFRTSSLLPKILLSSVLVLVLIVRQYEAQKLRRRLANLDEFEKDTSQ